MLVTFSTIFFLLFHLAIGRQRCPKNWDYVDRKIGFRKTFYTKCLYALIESIGPSIILRSICCWYTLELPHGGNSNVYLQHMSIQLMSAFHHTTGFHELLNYFLCFGVMSMQKWTSFCVVWHARPYENSRRNPPGIQAVSKRKGHGFEKILA